MATQAISNSSPWSGGKSPFRVSYGKLMMWIFLLSDAFTFSSLLVGYGALRYSFPSTQEAVDNMSEAQLKDIPLNAKGQIDFKVGENLIEKYAPAHPADAHAVEHADHFVEKMGEVGIFAEDHWPSPDLVFNHFPEFGFLHLHGSAPSPDIR